MCLLHLKSMFNVFFKEIGLWQSSCSHSVEGRRLSFIMRLLCLVHTALICQPPSTWWMGWFAQHNLAYLNLVSWAVQGLVRGLLLTSVWLYLTFAYWYSVNTVNTKHIICNHGENTYYVKKNNDSPHLPNHTLLSEPAVLETHAW